MMLPSEQDCALALLALAAILASSSSSGNADKELSPVHSDLVSRLRDILSQLLGGHGTNTELRSTWFYLPDGGLSLAVHGESGVVSGPRLTAFISVTLAEAG